jgi:hypothetical protein
VFLHLPEQNFFLRLTRAETVDALPQLMQMCSTTIVTGLAFFSCFTFLGLKLLLNCAAQEWLQNTFFIFLS